MPVSTALLKASERLRFSAIHKQLLTETWASGTDSVRQQATTLERLLTIQGNLDDFDAGVAGFGRHLPDGEVSYRGVADLLVRSF